MRLRIHATTFLLALPLLLAPPTAPATSVLPRPLEEIVLDADHVLSARIIRVDMVDALGRQVVDREARTGPGLRNRMRFHLEVDEVLFSTCKRPPRRVLAPLWQAWHYQLGAMQDQLTGSTGIFLLKGETFEPAYPAGFQRGEDERAGIEVAVDELRLEREPASMSCREAPRTSRPAT